MHNRVSFKPMFRPLFFLTILMGALNSCPFIQGRSPAQQASSIASEHVLMLMPPERESLGREMIADIERCYGFMNRATNTSLPRKILITVDWNRPDSDCDLREGSIAVGMNQPAALADVKGCLFRSTAREIARLGLLALSRGAQREDTEFLFEGMIEILVHEYDHSSRCLEASWAFCRFLDDMQMLGLADQRAWSKFSGGKRCLRNASPGIAFLTTFRELQGRERPLKLFEALRKKSLNESLFDAFKAPVAELEETWLKRVREYRIAEITTAAEEAPQLVRTTLVPDAVKPGGAIQLRLFLEDRARNLLPEGVFVRDERTGRVLQVKAASEKGVEFLAASIPVEANCPPGRFRYQVTAIDETGNVRCWSGEYAVESG
jgi:hypothetical protein